MKHQSTEKLKPLEEKGEDKMSEKLPEIRVVIEPPQKPAAPRWWDILGWVLRLVVALATLLKLLKDK